MSTQAPASSIRSNSWHRRAVRTGAGVWLGAAEAPTKLVNTGLSPFAISLCMVAGVFMARWSLPTLVKGTRCVFADLAQNSHLIPIAMLAGMLWAVANTLTVFAIRDVGLAIAFPLWNTNSLVGIFWGRLLFGELKGASAQNIAKVLLGSLAIVGAAIMLGFSTMHRSGAHASHAVSGILAAVGRQPAVGHHVHSLSQGLRQRNEPAVVRHRLHHRGTGHHVCAGAGCSTEAPMPPSSILPRSRHMLFWLFLGGFVWVIGDLFQQFATKYLGIGRGIPLSNTNQLWGLAWGALVFGELAHADATHPCWSSPGRWS